MTVRLRGTHYHYRFQIDGKNYSGVCNGCPTLKKAEAYEESIREEVSNIRRQKSVVALVENYKYELTGGRPIRLDEAFDLAAAKPAKRISTSSYANLRRTYWNDYTAFMAATFPETVHLAQIRRNQCEAYVSHLIQHGRFVRNVEYTLQSGRKAKQISYERDYLIAPKTIKEIAGVCRWVISCLKEDAGVLNNPWESVALPSSDPTPREIFTEDELLLIKEGLKDDDFCRPLFTVAALTGLTEGDICTLKWSEVSMLTSIIRHRRRKTGVWVEIPIGTQLGAYLAKLERRGEYIFPEHAELFLRGTGAVSDRVTSFLHRLGIETTVKVEGRKAVSVKDLHSMRHVFCYYAGQAGIPASTVQSIVGHMTPEMTRHYMRHDSAQSKLREIEKLPSFLSMEKEGICIPGWSDPILTGHFNDDDDYAYKKETPPDTAMRRKLAELAWSLPPEKIKQLLQAV